LTVKVSEKAVDVQNGHMKLKIEDRENIVFYCEVQGNKIKFDWIKDGVYLNRRINTIQPAITIDPSKNYINHYSMQGIYWCEAWTPGCSQKFSSNRVNLTFEGIITIHMHVALNSTNILHADEVAVKVNEKFQLCGTRRSINSDVRRGYTNVRNMMIATYDLHMYIQNDNLVRIISSVECFVIAVADVFILAAINLIIKCNILSPFTHKSDLFIMLISLLSRISAAIDIQDWQKQTQPETPLFYGCIIYIVL
jgi:hypothetical protein